MKRHAISAVLAGLLTTAAQADSMPGSALLMMDDDLNATVTYEEFADEMSRMFGLMDADKSGQLEFGEVESFMPRAVFDGADANSNGRISKQEYTARTRADFEAADKDGNGALN